MTAISAPVMPGVVRGLSSSPCALQDLRERLHRIIEETKLLSVDTKTVMKDLNHIANGSYQERPGISGGKSWRDVRQEGGS
jgi:hypothetical protein